MFTRCAIVTLNITEDMGFSQLPQDTQGLLAFEDFLRLEFRVENLMFCVRAKDFQDKFSQHRQSENEGRAVAIYNQFVSSLITETFREFFFISDSAKQDDSLR